MGSRGKDFEAEIKKALTLPNVSFDRFADPMAGFAGIRNICDFGCYKYPYKYYFECKERKGNTINFAADITKDQWTGLIEKSYVHGCLPGYIIWFFDHDVTVFVPALEMLYLRDIKGKKSLNIKDIINNNVIYIPVRGKKKRILFTYDGEDFLMMLFMHCSTLHNHEFWAKRGLRLDGFDQYQCWRLDYTTRHAETFASSKAD